MVTVSSVIGVIVYIGGTNVYMIDLNNLAYTSAAVDNINGSLFYALMVIGFGSVNNIVLLFPEERPIFMREVNNNMYSVSSYFFAKVLSELPASIIVPIVFGCIIYYAIGLSTVFMWKFPLFCKIMFQID